MEVNAKENKFLLNNIPCVIPINCKPIESVMTYNIQTKLRVQTFTALDQLMVNDTCNCSIQECIHEDQAKYERKVVQK
ncbi:Oidioi.mRNA.OKI2018_I69.chr2.g5220.t1.cds [Oikopleura dioica]|uniref:Oidioi.mRNA.OKI2018_I69.chr2.g5220.t1.cds n=1 Tax=Oikopleura dioica TaxID=34765 RepID=A0ABN7SZN7_OIKDI|nr:Oidioi.mRNA.OKI2018_I69.chr2.g5220.t1.cds [Oikopleura dioica]